MSRKRELRARIEECEFCCDSSADYCERHQGMIEELPPEYVVVCIDCGTVHTEVPGKGRVECWNCSKILMEPKGGSQ